MDVMGFYLEFDFLLVLGDLNLVEFFEAADGTD